MKKIRVVFYWISILPPLIDLIIGAINGVKKGIQDIKDKKNSEQQELWQQVNAGQRVETEQKKKEARRY
ncbi:MAG: hypothetical protein [Arizlama microvirus]|nr:MAG: hypothetical protein [Arizlama microvirus]